MNVRIDGTSLRFKVTDIELEELLAGETVVNQLTIGSTAVTVLIDPKPALPEGMCTQFLTEKESTVLRLMVGAETLIQLKNMGKSRDGISVTNGGTTLYLLVDARKTRAG